MKEYERINFNNFSFRCHNRNLLHKKTNKRKRQCRRKSNNKQLKETKNEYEEQAEILLDNASEYRTTITELEEFKNQVTDIVKSEHFAHDKVEKIKELISDSESEN